MTDLRLIVYLLSAERRSEHITEYPGICDVLMIRSAGIHIGNVERVLQGPYEARSIGIGGSCRRPVEVKDREVHRLRATGLTSLTPKRFEAFVDDDRHHNERRCLVSPPPSQ